jgi:hypothetical protein
MARVIGTCLAALVLLAPGAVQAQDYVRMDCQPVVQPTLALKFETDRHALWYKRFWTGSCAAGLPLCLPGSPNWNDVVSKLVAKGEPQHRAVLLPKACRVGQLIGLEWARDKRIQRIRTADLKVFNAMLESAGDPLTGLERVEGKAQAMIAGR